jgi:hypothetical protein
MIASLLTCRFPHRPNGDGLHNSICISCYARLASVRNEAYLAQHEQDHVRDSVFLNYACQPSRVPRVHSLEESA